MKHGSMKKAVLLALTAALALCGTAAALFGRGTQEREQGAPTARAVTLRTYRGMAREGAFSADDEADETLTYTVVDGPRKGSVRVEGERFVYTPKEGAVGNDRFTYTAEDSEGKVSSPASVTVRIEKPRSGVDYADMKDSPAAVAAQDLAECGVFTGTKIGERYYFAPDQTVSRSEFLAMVLESSGRTVTPVTMTGFCDDGDIPVWAKSYVSAGVAEGIVRGKTTAEGAAFYGGDDITLSEAATVLNRVLDLGDVDLAQWYADREAVPSWAAQAVGNMEAMSVLAAGSFGSDSLERAVTRAEAAEMLCAARTLLTGGEMG